MTDQDLLQRAVAAADAAYAPYSNFHVGAAMLLRNGEIVDGVNVENASYPLGVCAERAALSRAARRRQGARGDRLALRRLPAVAARIQGRARDLHARGRGADAHARPAPAR